MSKFSTIVCTRTLKVFLIIDCNPRLQKRGVPNTLIFIYFLKNHIFQVQVGWIQVEVGWIFRHYGEKTKIPLRLQAVKSFFLIFQQNRRFLDSYRGAFMPPCWLLAWLVLAVAGWMVRPISTSASTPSSTSRYTCSPAIVFT